MVYVTALPRSGTMYVAEVLRRLGLDVGHEVQGRDGMVAWKLLVDPPKPRPGDTRLHQVRHPLDCIASMESLIDRNLRLIGERTGIEELDVKSVRFRMEAWLRWNARAEAWAGYTYRVESLPEIWFKFCSWLGVERRDEALKVSTTTNARKGRYNPLTWEDLRAADEELFAMTSGMATRYGYTI